MAATPAPNTPPAGSSTFGEVWAFRSFVLLFLLTLVIGLTHYVLSWIKYRT